METPSPPGDRGRSVSPRVAKARGTNGLGSESDGPAVRFARGSEPVTAAVAEPSVGGLGCGFPCASHAACRLRPVAFAGTQLIARQEGWRRHQARRAGSENSWFRAIPYPKGRGSTRRTRDQDIPNLLSKYLLKRPWHARPVLLESDLG